MGLLTGSYETGSLIRVKWRKPKTFSAILDRMKLSGGGFCFSELWPTFQGASLGLIHSCAVLPASCPAILPASCRVCCSEKSSTSAFPASKLVLLFSTRSLVGHSNGACQSNNGLLVCSALVIALPCAPTLCFALIFPAKKSRSSARTKIALPT